MRTAVLITRDKPDATPEVEYLEDVPEAKKLYKKAVAAGKGAELWLSDGGRTKRKSPRGEEKKARAPKNRNFAEGQAKADEVQKLETSQPVTVQTPAVVPAAEPPKVDPLQAEADLAIAKAENLKADEEAKAALAKAPAAKTRKPRTVRSKNK